MSETIPFEKPTDELRQVVRTIDYTHDDYSQRHLDIGVIRRRGETSVVVKVQRKWLVQDGEAYYAPESRSKRDIYMAGWHPLPPDIGFRWMPTKDEWRDLPAVNQSTT